MSDRRFDTIGFLTTGVPRMIGGEGGPAYDPGPSWFRRVWNRVRRLFRKASK